MEEISDYKIVTGDTAQELTGAVRVYIDQGWQPYAGMTININGEFAQPIVRYVRDVIQQEIRGEVIPPPAMPEGLEDEIRRMGTPRKRRPTRPKANPTGTLPRSF